jgi:hypothetical protein
MANIIGTNRLWGSQAGTALIVIADFGIIHELQE